MTTTTMTAEITVTCPDNSYATDSFDVIADDIECALLETCGFPHSVEIKVVIKNREVTSQ